LENQKIQEEMKTEKQQVKINCAMDSNEPKWKDSLPTSPYSSDVITPIFSMPRRLSLFLTAVAAGFPSPADDYIEKKLDLNEHLVKHPASTFFVRVAGDSMINAGIHHNDILIVDRSLEALDKKIIIACLNGELTVKRMRIKAGHVTLEPENNLYQTLYVDNEMSFEIWGVVTNVIHPL